MKQQLKTSLTGLAFMIAVYLLFAFPCGTLDASQWSGPAATFFILIELIALVVIFLRMDE